MKLQCSCGAKYEFEITPEIAKNGVKFVCPKCGVDSSEFVEKLVRQELGLGPAPVPPGGSAPPLRVSGPVRVTTRAQTSADPVPSDAPDGLDALCLKHPGERAVEKCYVCSKPICPKCMELFGHVCSALCKAKAQSHGISIPAYAGQKSVVQARFWKQVGTVSYAVGAVILALVGFWFWYAWFGSLPKTVFSVRFPEPAYSGQSVITGKDKDQIVFLHGGTLARHELRQKKQIWSCELIDQKQIAREVEEQIKSMQQQNARLADEGRTDLPRIPSADRLQARLERGEAANLQLHVRGQNVWVASAGKLVRYDWQTGRVAQEIAVPPGFGGLIPEGNELLVVDAANGKPVITRINLTTCDSRTVDFSGTPVPVAAAGTRANGGVELAGMPLRPGSDGRKPLDPAKVAEQAQHMSMPARIALPALLAASFNQERALAEMDDAPRRASSGAPANALPSASVSLFPSKKGFVQLSVQLLESRIVERSAMKAPPAKSVLDGTLTTGNTLDAANEILNDMQRARGGDVVREDLSRYQVSLRQPGSKDAWTGEVIGPPSVFPLDTVNVLTANQLLVVLDKSNHKRWQGTLKYRVQGGIESLDPDTAVYGQGPCVERKGSLYVFDEAVLTAFDIANGNARWRLPSVGIAGLFFDDEGMIYVNTTTASPEKLKYSRQIDLSDKVKSVAMKVDSKDGRVVWSTEVRGLVNYVSGKFIYSFQSYTPPEPDEEELQVAETGFETPPYMRLRRLNPRTGQEIWEHFQQRAPLDVQFDKNTIRLVFKKEVQVLKFLTFGG
jgi:hypothetical protein